MCCSTIAKCIFMVINVLVLIISTAFIALGTIVAFTPDILAILFKAAETSAALTSHPIPLSADVLNDFPLLYELGIGLFVLGGVLFIISFLGCCGSCCSCFDWMLILFAVVMVILMIVEIVIGTMFFVTDSPLHDFVRQNLKDRLAHFDYREDTKDSFSIAINLVNYLFKCCGIDGIEDFPNPDLPKPETLYSCSTEYPPSIVRYQGGCYTKLTDVIHEYILYAGLVFAALLLFQLIQVICAIVIQKKNKVSPF
ncbi:unnamed protein product [Lymnaea stagnalis]|uniref:Tetraspanin n=1 Tax=Lymnaea stagnalis TaxID=6523 RepID=A0AAV2H7Z4_LYMST